MSKWVAKRDDGNHDEGRHRWGMPKMRRHWGAWVIPLSQEGTLSTVIPEYPRYSGILVQVMTI